MVPGTKKNKTQPPATLQNFPIVGIGASAGGLDAFRKLLAAIPEQSGMAYVLVQHLDPSHESILPEILQRVTNIPVHEITEDIHLAPNHIYIIPENKILTSTDGILQLSARKKDILNLSIDIFFTSLAEIHKDFAIGIVLTGTGKDGTLGLKAIKENGGICIAQDVKSAAYTSMPQSAIDAGVVDYILVPEKIPEQLLRINDAFKATYAFTDKQEIVGEDGDNFKEIISILHNRSGVDFSFYKKPTFHRRIARRIAMAKKNSLSEYVHFLSTNVTEQDALFEDVLIPVTSFFRNPTTFQHLCDTVFPELFKNRAEDEPFRVWVAGCSTGEEAYSIAICLHEFLGEKLNQNKVQIFASDISEKVIEKARVGIYSKAQVEAVSAAQLERYFVKKVEGYEICKLIRDMCVIAPHNFLKDPPFVKMDLISCRNVLIYMDAFLQNKAFTTFHYALKEDGFLMLGKSESVGASSDLFTQVNKSEKIYARKPVSGRFLQITNDRKKDDMKAKGTVASKKEAIQTDFRKSAEAVMLSKSPASVVVNAHLEIVHIHGDITTFLQVPQGKPTHNLLKMAREGLGFELRNAIHKAAKEKETVIKEHIPLKVKGLLSDSDDFMEGQGKQYLITLEITPLVDTVEPHFLIRFEKKVIPSPQQENASSHRKMKKSITEKRNEQLEKELAYIREDMRSITEDMESDNDELQSANEEFQSSNEEMQSLNEELETSNEELQSTNEELIIVNQELMEKQEQLNISSHYAESIVSTIREPLIILDKTLKIKTANASFYKVFNAEEQETEGKLFYEIQNHQWDDELMRTLLEKILPEKQRLTDLEIKLKFPSRGTRTLLLNALQIINEKNAEKLILLAIEDITDRRLTEQKLKTFSDDLETQVVERTAALKKSIEDLKQTNMQLDQFAHVASHDLQEPLRKISIFTKRLQSAHKDELSTEMQSYINRIEGASNRMSLLIQDLLNYSRLLQNEKIFLKTDLNVIVKSVLTDFDLLIHDKKATIYCEKLPSIDAIPVQMHQLFNNIISNALKFSNGNLQPIITIKAHALTEKQVQDYPNLNPENSHIEIIIKDNGIGFNEEYAKRIFIIFQRLHGNETFTGTGIGLALCKKIVENHKGEIFAHSHDNEGASFHIILPVLQS